MARHATWDRVNFRNPDNAFSTLDRPTPVLTLPPNVSDRFVSREIADRRAQAASLQHYFKNAENYASSLQDELQSQADAASAAAELQGRYDELLERTTALAEENRRMGGGAHG